MVNVRELKRKIVLIGDWGVGKTSLIRKFVLDTFDDKYLVTFGTKVTKKRIKFIVDKDNITDMNLMIWDVMGQKEFKKVQTNAYRGTQGALIVCDITRAETLESIPKWKEEILEVTEKIPIIILANKVDLKDSCQVTTDDLIKVANELNVSSFFTSAKTGENVENAFQELGIKLMY